MDKFKNELETLYDERVEGIVVRARARWHEHGEKSSKYFLNLEKRRNNIKNHVRKLYLSGAFSTDPFEINLNAENLLYSKLYSRQRVVLNSEQAKSILEKPNILKLNSDELSSRCEGKITFQECESISGSFQVGKTPGNDGIPIEFYKIFWPLIGEFLLVASFNEAFDNNEMSSSQKQALITLIEKKEKDRNYSENWRPISLINVDAKIASKGSCRQNTATPHENYATSSSSSHVSVPCAYIWKLKHARF